MSNLNFNFMQTGNFIVEVIENGEGIRYFIVREIVPNSAPKTVLVTDEPNEVANFLDTVKL